MRSMFKHDKPPLGMSTYTDRARYLVSVKPTLASELVQEARRAAQQTLRFPNRRTLAPVDRALKNLQSTPPPHPRRYLHPRNLPLWVRIARQLVRERWRREAAWRVFVRSSMSSGAGAHLLPVRWYI